LRSRRQNVARLALLENLPVRVSGNSVRTEEPFMIRRDVMLKKILLATMVARSLGV